LVSWICGVFERYLNMANKIIDLNWTDFKLRLSLKNSKIQEEIFKNNYYQVFFIENETEYHVELLNGSADGIDYVNNYRPAANAKTIIPVEGTFTANIDDISIDFKDGPNLDGFHRQRISEPFTMFDSKQLHDKQPLFWDEVLNGTATSVHDESNAKTLMTVNANADYVIRQTYMRFNYQPGKSILVSKTFTASKQANAIKRIGQFCCDTTNVMSVKVGIFLKVTGTNISWNIANNNIVTESILQANWNLDKLDGTGLSGITYNDLSSQILIFDYQWLAVGRVRVGFDFGNKVVYVHEFLHANSTFTNPYMSTPNNPLRYDIESTGGVAELSHICSTILSEGGFDNNGVLRSIDTKTTSVSPAVSGSTYLGIAIRHKVGWEDIVFFPIGVSIVSGANESFRWALVLNPTYTSVGFTGLIHSSMEYEFGDETLISDPGIELGSGYTSRTNLTVDAGLKTALRAGMSITGDRDKIAILITPLTNNQNVYVAANMRELL